MTPHLPDIRCRIRFYPRNCSDRNFWHACKASDTREENSATLVSNSGSCTQALKYSNAGKSKGIPIGAVKNDHLLLDAFIVSWNDAKKDCFYIINLSFILLFKKFSPLL